MSEKQPVYLGDGVYATFDGDHIWLHLGSHTSAPLIALEQEVFESLKHYAEKVWRKGR